MEQFGQGAAPSRTVVWETTPAQPTLSLRFTRGRAPMSRATDSVHLSKALIVIAFPFFFMICLLASDVLAQERGPLSLPPNANVPPEEAISRAQLLLVPLLGAALGFFLGLWLLVKKFRRFWGLCLVMNRYSGLFLAVMAAFPAASCMGLVMLGAQTEMWEVVEQLLQSLPKMLGVGVGGSGLTILLARLFRRSRLDTGTTDQVRDLTEVESTNLFFELIRDHAIPECLHQEITQIARRYDWDSIRNTARQLIHTLIVTSSLTPEEGEAALQNILRFEPCAEAETDFNNKYDALLYAVKVCPFDEFRSRLAMSLSEQP